MVAFDKKDLEKLKSKNECKKCDLKKANLSYADLSGANLSNTNLEYVNLNKADLSGVMKLSPLLNTICLPLKSF